MPAENDDTNHQRKIKEVDWQKVLPFERKKLVDAETGKCPLKPDDDKRENYCLTDKPHYRRKILHDVIEAIPTRNVERHPTAKEEERCNACNDK